MCKPDTSPQNPFLQLLSVDRIRLSDKALDSNRPSGTCGCLPVSAITNQGPRATTNLAIDMDPCLTSHVQTVPHPSRIPSWEGVLAVGSLPLQRWLGAHGRVAKRTHVCTDLRNLRAHTMS
jgi:hypothetical protein